MPRLSCIILSFVACACCAGFAFAQTAALGAEPPVGHNRWRPSAPRLRLAPFTGLAAPFGKVSPNLELRDATRLSYLIGGDLAWGPVLPLDFGIIGAAMLSLGEPQVCPQPSRSCTVAVGAQLALRARYYFRPEERFTPWLALGAGLEVLESTGQSTHTDAGILLDETTVTQRSASYLGPLALLQGGVDFRLEPKTFARWALGLQRVALPDRQRCGQRRWRRRDVFVGLARATPARVAVRGRTPDVRPTLVARA